jgi:O-antigen/teichoic acid export membrane protein
MIIVAVFMTVSRQKVGVELTSVLFIACILLPINIVQQIRAGFIRAFKKVVLAQSPQALIRPMLIIFGLSILYIGSNEISAEEAMSVNVLAALFVLMLTTYILSNLKPYQCKETVADYQTIEWFKVAFPLFLIAGIHLFLNQVGILMIGYLLNTTKAGIYAVTERVSSFILIGLTAVNAILAPIMSEYYVQNKIKELKEIILLAARIILIITIPITIVVIAWGDFVLGLFGEEFTYGYSALKILVIGQLINALAGPVGFIMVMTKYHKEAAIFLVSCAIINIILNIYLIPSWGIKGAAISSAIITILWNLLASLFIWKKMGIRAMAI